jgi:predicted  nucleic acid-binding Zn-ribbon protein
LAAVTLETPNVKMARRQVTQLREENRHLRFDLDTQRAEVQRLTSKYEELKSKFESEVAVIHNGQQQEIVQYQKHLQEVMNEHNRVQEAYTALEQRYQELSTSFQHALEEQANKHVTTPAHDVNLESPPSSETSQGAKKEGDRQTWEEGDRYLAEAVYLKREAKRMIDTLQEERQQLATQRQELYSWQYNMREQAALRQKTLHDRLHARWRVASLLTSLGLVGLLIVLQIVCLALLHVALAVPIAFALVAPIVVCIGCAFIFTRPLTMVHHMFKSAPHKKKAQK